jgi:hypothetical protein
MKSRILIESENDNKDLNDEEQVAEIKNNNIEIKIVLPTDYLLKNYSNNITNYGAILYNNYPLLRTDFTNISQSVISLRLFNNEYEEIETKNLSKPIKIYIKKPEASFNNCIFYEPNNKTWDNLDCISKDLGLYTLCECKHLTDFTLANYNPVAIFNDIKNILEDIRVMDGFEDFKDLNWNNALVFYYFFTILTIYLIGLVFTLRYDFKHNKDFLLKETERQLKCCSNEEVMECIQEVKEITDKAIESKQKEKLKKYFLDPIKNQDMKKKIMKAFNINNLSDNDENTSVDNKNKIMKESINNRPKGISYWFSNDKDDSVKQIKKDENDLKEEVDLKEEGDKENETEKKNNTPVHKKSIFLRNIISKNKDKNHVNKLVNDTNMVEMQIMADNKNIKKIGDFDIDNDKNNKINISNVFINSNLYKFLIIF